MIKQEYYYELNCRPISRKFIMTGIINNNPNHYIKMVDDDIEIKFFSCSGKLEKQIDANTYNKILQNSTNHIFFSFIEETIFEMNGNYQQCIREFTSTYLSTTINMTFNTKEEKEEFERKHNLSKNGFPLSRKKQ